jgi:Protein of unknown function (DUF1214)
MEWSQFVDRIAKLDNTFEHLIRPDDPWLRQEAVQLVAMSLAQGYHAILAQDIAHPQFFSFLNPVIKSAAPNPDYMYRFAFLDSAGTYRISGFRGSTLFVHFAISTGVIGVDDVPGPVVGNIDLDTLTIGPDGAFELILSRQRPEGYDGDWYELDARAVCVSVREASYDWLTEVDCRLAIERLDGQPRLRRWTPDEIASKLERLAGFPARYLGIFLPFVKNLRQQHPVNELVQNTWADIGGLEGQIYFEGTFELDDDEALILETDVPDTVRYWQVLLADELFNTIDWEKCQSSLNGHQAHVDNDGRFRAVIATRDPGVVNWLDPAERTNGVIQMRFYQASHRPSPTLKRVKLSELGDHLPADTRRVSASERKEILLARFRGAQLRRKW